MADVYHEGTLLEVADQGYRLPSLRGRLTVSFRDGQELAVPLFENEPLFFKLHKNWKGVGRRIARITSGYFIVIVPDGWKRRGHETVEPDSCTDPVFSAHYFYRDANASEGSDDGFTEWNDFLVFTGIELNGRCIHDDSDDGLLFVERAPNLNASPKIRWARVGEEVGHGWGKNFRPDRQSLPDVLAGREGRFFLRVYDQEVNLLDSVAFRYIRDLTRIEVDGTEYAQGTVLVPTKTGYGPTEVRFIGTDGSPRTPVLRPEAHQDKSQPGAIMVPPRPQADRIACSLGSDAGAVNITLDLPRIWWRLEDGQPNPGEWCDTPLVMTREQFRNQANSDVTLWLLSKRLISVHAGFDDQPGQPYTRKTEDDHITIPLKHFIYHAQIAGRLNADAHFNVEWAEKIVTLVVILADPIPEIVSFNAKPATVLGGDEAVLEWMIRNARDVRVAIEPDLGMVGSNGSCVVRPTRTTRYTLILTPTGTSDISRTTTVVVGSPSARVKSGLGGWRSAKGFSAAELLAAGMTVAEAVVRSIPVDRRRRTSHQANVDAIKANRSMFNV